MMDLNMLKLLAMLLIWCITLVSCVIPLATQWMNPRTRDRVLSIASAGAGGVFLAGGFLHLLTDDRELFEQLTDLSSWRKMDGLPLAELCACFGFLFVFFLEKVLFANVGKKKKKIKTEEVTEEVVPVTPAELKKAKKETVEEEEDDGPPPLVEVSLEEGGQEGFSFGDPSVQRSGPFVGQDIESFGQSFEGESADDDDDIPSLVEVDEIELKEFASSSNKHSSCEEIVLPCGDLSPHNHGHSHQQADHHHHHHDNDDQFLKEKKLHQEDHHHHHHHEGDHHHHHHHHEGHGHSHGPEIPDEDAPIGTRLLAFFLMFVLSIHSLIEGLALGVQPTEEGVIAIFVAIISHKWVESLALGSSLMRSKTATSTIVILAVVYSFVTPTGILLGFLSQQILEGTYSVAFTAIVTGISAGTFVYIATIDILTEEFRSTHDRFPKFASTVFGFALTSALFIFLDKD